MYSAGTAFLKVVPSFKDVETAFRRQTEQMAKDIEQAVSDALPKAMAEAGKKAREEGERAGEKYAGAFVGQLRKHMDAASKTFGTFELKADASQVEKTIAEMQQDLKTLRDAKIGVELTEGEFFAEVERIKRKAEQLERTGITIEVRSNARALISELEAVEKLRTDDTTARMKQRGHRDGVQYGGAFNDAVQKRLGAMLNAIGSLNLRVDDTGVAGQLAAIQRRAERLMKVDIGVDMSASEFYAELGAMEAALAEFERDDVEIHFKTNARIAMAEVKALREYAEGGKKEKDGNPAKRGAEDGAKYAGAFATTAKEVIKAALEAMGGEVELDADATPAQREIAGLRAELARLADVKIGVDVDAATVLATFNRIETRMRELSADEVDVQVKTNLLATAVELSALQKKLNELDGKDVNVKVDTNGASAQMQQMAQLTGLSLSRLGLLISLGASIGTAIVPAAAVAAASIGAIATAASAAVIGVGVLGLGLFQVVGAVQALHKFQQDSNKSATSLAASQDRVANALAGVRSAQRALARAERDRQQAVAELAKAQEEARRQLEDMANAVKANSLAQRQARLDEIEAKRELDEILANPRATEEEREQARITHEERLLQIDELKTKQERLTADKKEADRKGVAGSDQVLAAQERIANATDALIGAQESLASSQRSLAQAYDKTGVAGGAALDNLQEAMAGLSPAGRRFALFIFGLKDEFKGLQHAAEEGLLPGLEEGIKRLLPFLPQVETLVGKVASALGGIFVEFVDSLQDPTWQKFFGYMADTAVPVLQGMFRFASNVARGLAGIVMGLSGFNGSIGDGLLKWSEGFAEWATTLEDDEGWQKFLAYVREAAPKVLELLRNMWIFTEKFVAAAAPIGLFVVEAFAKLFGWLDKIDSDTWTIIIAGIAGIGAAMLAVAAVTAAIGTGLTGAIIAGIALVGTALAILYNKVKPFRDAVDFTIAAIGKAAVWLYEAVLKPTFANIVTAVGVVQEIFRTLYEQIFVHVFSLITGVVLGFWETLKTFFGEVSQNFSRFQGVFSFVFGLLRTFVQNAGAGFVWLWEHALKPVFGVIGVAFGVFKAAFQVAFGLFQIALKIAGAAWRWFYDNAIMPVVRLLKPVFDWLRDVIKKHVEPGFRAGLQALGKAWDVLVEASKTPLKFIVNTLLNDGLLAGYNTIAKFFKVKPDDVRINLPKGFAVGGAVFGPGTATSDSVPAMLSAGEHVWTAKEVEAAGGHGMIYALRRAVLGGMLPGFARGGAVGGRGWGDGLGDLLAGLKKKASDAFNGVKDFLTDPAGSLRRLADKLLALVPGKDTAAVKVLVGMPNKALDSLVGKVKDLFSSDNSEGGGVSAGGLGWQRMMQILRAQFPNLPLNSGFRPGAVTISGNRSWHSVGRAVDVPPRADVFNWIREHFPNSRELIFSPMGRMQIRNGKPWLYSGAVRDTHFDHVHWAYDSGGFLPPGYSTVFNGTGRPEPVLTSQQWNDISALTKGSDGPRTVNNFTFRDTTLDAGKLRAQQDRDDALSRQGRAR